MVSKARLDLPEPESPVITIRAFRGILRCRSLRLCSRAPETTSSSCGFICPSLEPASGTSPEPLPWARKMRFGYTILYVRDVPASVEFYERAFGLERRLVHESGQYAEMETGATALAFAARDLAAENLPDELRPGPPGDHPSYEVCLVTEDVGAGFKRAVDA